MTYVMGDGKSNWLEGAILICSFPYSDFSIATDMSLMVQVFTSMWP